MLIEMRERPQEVQKKVFQQSTEALRAMGKAGAKAAHEAGARQKIREEEEKIIQKAEAEKRALREPPPAVMNEDGDMVPPEQLQ